MSTTAFNYEALHSFYADDNLFEYDPECNAVIYSAISATYYHACHRS